MTQAKVYYNNVADVCQIFCSDDTEDAFGQDLLKDNFNGKVIQ